MDMKIQEGAMENRHRLVRFIWGIAWPLLTWFLPRSMGGGWKRFLLRLFGASVHRTANVYTTARIYYPANLEMRENSCLASRVECYNVDRVVIGKDATVSQGSFLCTASHDILKKDHPLITAPIVIEDKAWVAAEAFIGMGVTVGEGAVVGARAAVFKDVEPWTVVGGNPAKFIKKREIIDA